MLRTTVQKNSFKLGIFRFQLSARSLFLGASRSRQPVELRRPALHRRTLLPLLAILPLQVVLAAGAHTQPSTDMSQDRLVNHLIAEGVVKHADVEKAMRSVDRRAFCCTEGLPAHYAYQDSPLPIGYGETISAPHMHATCLELLRSHLKPGARVLDVGSGSGYLTAAMATMVQPGGKVVGIEKHPELAQAGERNIAAAMPELLRSGAVEVRAGNVLGDALQGEEEPFDAIHVGAAADRLPDVLVRSLAPGGRMVIPVGPQWDFQVMQVVDKDASGRITKHNMMGVRYVPLTHPGEQEF